MRRNDDLRESASSVVSLPIVQMDSSPAGGKVNVLLALLLEQGYDVVGVTLHDVILPFMPIVFRLEYDVGYWLLNHPHELPPNLTTHELSIHQWLSWTTFVTAGVPLLVGSFFFSAPTSIVTYWTTRLVLHRRTLAKLKQRTA